MTQPPPTTKGVVRWRHYAAHCSGCHRLRASGSNRREVLAAAMAHREDTGHGFAFTTEVKTDYLSKDSQPL